MRVSVAKTYNLNGQLGRLRKEVFSLLWATPDKTELKKFGLTVYRATVCHSGEGMPAAGHIASVVKKLRDRNACAQCDSLQCRTCTGGEAPLNKRSGSSLFW